MQADTGCTPVNHAKLLAKRLRRYLDVEYNKLGPNLTRAKKVKKEQAEVDVFGSSSPRAGRSSPRAGSSPKAGTEGAKPPKTEYHWKIDDQVVAAERELFNVGVQGREGILWHEKMDDIMFYL
jgi:hypothetical protein